MTSHNETAKINKVIAYYLAAHHHEVNVLLSNIVSLIFAVLVVSCHH